MNKRQQNLHEIIIAEYIKTAEPVSSKFISQAGNFDLSSATIRNEMAELEDQGYIFHPHTSAGRVPTEKGYRFFVENYIADFALNKRAKDCLDKVLKPLKYFEPQAVKELAKEMAELSGGAVLIAFSDNNFYYTGLANLFSQPEFIEHRLVASLSRVIDHLDRVINKIYKEIDSEVKIDIGRRNPFAQDCSSVLTRFQCQKQAGILGILGPIRMDYKNNAGLVGYSRQLIENLGSR
ncbi:MAG: hypothetical protein A3H67_03020 [Candidatus Buchananbacteria bacterium RIFCSPLOWO2_02_FULL_46_11b]|uniref:Heat-inducible transcription repressor HrcA C-terminal domain-containing protein n=1 Tax=Candidatus Buchananbacteria bacterium RIFCSPLOWO2_02_FULL_46_11b TaxID=1797548 RepID=A0A1G1YXS2_9BACT|nr:MAG: hypothetical protein A3H67_03020 [Candidatus Buchananbacteria bacterium RIFCSPLOWO2_02_FULL_46_11b]